MVAERRNSPFSGRPSTSRLMACCRSPLATAEMARVTSVVGHSRSSIRVLTDCSIAPQAPERRSLDMRWRVLPSLPTIWPTRSSSRARRWLAVTISLKVSATLPASPVWSLASRTEKSPSRTLCSACSSLLRSRSGLPGTGGLPLVLRAARAESCGCCISKLRVKPWRCRKWCGREATPSSVCVSGLKHRVAIGNTDVGRSLQIAPNRCSPCPFWPAIAWPICRSAPLPICSRSARKPITSLAAASDLRGRRRRLFPIH